MLCLTKYIPFQTTLFLSGVFLSISVISCNQAGQPARSDSQSQVELESILKHYGNAPYYVDKASVVLHYFLNGAPYEEIHPCSTRLVRDQSSYFQRFKLEVHGQQDLFIARVLDPQTQNLGGQVLCYQNTVSKAWKNLLDDRIATHFAIGGDDIPWHDDLMPRDIHQFLNIPLSMFLGNQPDWMSQTNLIESTEVEVDGKTYLDATFRSKSGPIACRFDTRKQALVGIRLPRQVLSANIQSTPGIQEVSLAILFQDISFAESQPARPLLRNNEQPVSQFVQLPEEFPSSKIGKSIEAWGLVAERNQVAYNPKVTQGSPAIFFYGFEQQYSSEELNLIESLSRELPMISFTWISPAAISVDQDNRQVDLTKSSRMRNIVDPAGEFLRELEVTSANFYLIVDAKGVIQFVASRKQNWLQQISPILKRIAEGDDVAREMHTEYSTYHADYQEKLRAARADQALIESLILN